MRRYSFSHRPSSVGCSASLKFTPFHHTANSPSTLINQKNIPLRSRMFDFHPQDCNRTGTHASEDERKTNERNIFVMRIYTHFNPCKLPIVMITPTPVIFLSVTQTQLPEQTVIFELLDSPGSPPISAYHFLMLR